MDTARLKEILSRLRSDKRAVTLTAAAGILGLLMIIFSGGDKNEEQTADIAEKSGSGWENYCTRTEERLESILSAIDGAGKVEVMVSVSSTEEYVYASSGSIAADREEFDCVTVKKDKNEEALVRKINAPVITGVVAVCEGGDSDRVREEIYRAVTAALDIPSSRVYVAPME
ncbi:MAG: hypothetical protein NC120_05655 [Ruminococcus sp.]|nr:hypothetical protein [Ruminococcus sp.]